MTTIVRQPRHPLTAAALRGELDLDGLDCPLCTYRMAWHERLTAGGVTTWRCPSEAEARERSGSQ